nr:probable metal-nicotianamine transporter YSL7 [Tanacetum cinerariifolium]
VKGLTSRRNLPWVGKGPGSAKEAQTKCTCSTVGWHRLKIIKGVPYPLVSSLHVFKPSSLPYGASAPVYGAHYRGIALLGVEGFSSLPHNCLKISIGFFIAAILLNLLTVILNKCEKKYEFYRFIPTSMCMAIPFYLGAYFAINMCIGSLILFIWEKKNKKSAKEIVPVVASGMICGDSLWGVPTAIMYMFSVKAPICMKFLSASVNTKVDGCFGWFINVHGLWSSMHQNRSLYVHGLVELIAIRLRVI